MAAVRDIAERIVERRKIYAAAYECDIRRLSAEHGAESVQEALALIEQRAQRDADHWDKRGHRQAVERAIGRVLQEHRRGAEDER